MSDRPLAYHITFGTYGTRLHGDARGTVDRSFNKSGDPIIGLNVDWHDMEASSLKGQPVVFDQSMRVIVEHAIDRVCEQGDWLCHTSACQHNHVHILVTSIDEGKLTRRLMKRWLTQDLNNVVDISPYRWWAKGGSVKWVWNQMYFDNVYEYVRQQRTSKTEPRRPRRGPP